MTVDPEDWCSCGEWHTRNKEPIKLVLLFLRPNYGGKTANTEGE
jgi:hypothetical protein